MLLATEKTKAQKESLVMAASPGKLDQSQDQGKPNKRLACVGRLGVAAGAAQMEEDYEKTKT